MLESVAYLALHPAPFRAHLGAATDNTSISSFSTSSSSSQAPQEDIRECQSCGIPLRVIRRKFERLHLPEAMTAHLCITTYRSPQNEVLKLECSARVMGAMLKKMNEDVFTDGKLCFVGQDCHRIPSILGATYGMQTKRLDLSYNAIRSLEGLDRFPYLEELVLDNNFIDDAVVLPRLDTLHTLSLNKNKVSDLARLLDQVSERFPNLRYLSLLGNKACPDQLTGDAADERDYRSYRLYVLHRLPELRFLDSTAVRRSEAREARKRGSLARGSRATSAPPPSLLAKTGGEGVMCMPAPLQSSLPSSPVSPPATSPFHGPPDPSFAPPAKEINGKAPPIHAPLTVRHTGSQSVTPPRPSAPQLAPH